jgi:hypothetical protein
MSAANLYRAACCVRALRARPRLIVPAGHHVPADLAREYRALCARARAITEATPRSEYVGIWTDFTELADAYGLKLINERIN